MVRGLDGLERLTLRPYSGTDILAHPTSRRVHTHYPVRTIDRRRAASAEWPRWQERRRPVSKLRPPPREVLLVDDDVGFIETFGALLRHEGYAVVAEFTVPNALSYLSSHTPDALITDLRFGEGDGWTLARYARTHQPTLPVIVVTGSAYVLETEEQYGRIPVFLKPFDPGALFKYLESVLSS